MAQSLPAGDKLFVADSRQPTTIPAGNRGERVKGEDKMMMHSYSRSSGGVVLFDHLYDPEYGPETVSSSWTPLAGLTLAAVAAAGIISRWRRLRHR